MPNNILQNRGKKSSDADTDSTSKSTNVSGMKIKTVSPVWKKKKRTGKDLYHTLDTNPTLRFAHEQGMRFKFISREDYRRKEKQEFLDELRLEFGDFYQIQEGGTNTLAIKGCEEILTPADNLYDFIHSIH